ncbi:hypothetical protein EVA_17355 [gut metagenome]|uniref:Uncharacterized protein n=1 Tax=gut metagenome TaxID=749906 RepID=J9G4Y7_9ZZZZ
MRRYGYHLRYTSGRSWFWHRKLPGLSCDRPADVCLLSGFHHNGHE